VAPAAREDSRNSGLCARPTPAPEVGVLAGAQELISAPHAQEVVERDFQSVLELETWQMMRGNAIQLDGFDLPEEEDLHGARGVLLH
jgi:hypothetical protein